MKYKKELNKLYAELDYNLYIAQRSYENAIKKYGLFREAYINAKVKYENKLSEIIEKLYKKGDKVTVVQKIAHGKCMKEYHDMLMYETKYKKYRALMNGFLERINMIKYLMKIKIGELGN